MSPAPDLVGVPKSAAYEIELGGDERAELEHRAACSTLSFRQLRRARLVRHAAESYQDALKPWQQRAWIFVRDPAFRESGARAGPIPAALGGTPVAARRPGDLRRREVPAAGARPRHETVAARPGRPAQVEFEHRRRGTVVYLAAWDVHHASLFDRVEPRTGIEPSGRLVEQVMTSEPYASARTVYWIVDDGSSHAGRASIERLEGGWQHLRLVHLPIHAQPDRALLLDRPAQGAQPQQLRLT
jgi:hypothetical protein